MTTHNLELQDALRTHRQNTLIKEQHEASLVRDPDVVIEPPYEIDESIFMTPYEQVYASLDPADRAALDLREKYEKILTSSDFTDYETYCAECGDIGSVVRESGGLCSECWIDESIRDDTPDLLDIVTQHFAGDVIIVDDNLPEYIEKYIDYTRELDKRVAKQIQEMRAQ